MKMFFPAGCMGRWFRSLPGVLASLGMVLTLAACGGGGGGGGASDAGTGETGCPLLGDSQYFMPAGVVDARLEITGSHLSMRLICTPATPGSLSISGEVEPGSQVAIEGGTPEALLGQWAEELPKTKPGMVQTLRVDAEEDAGGGTPGTSGKTVLITDLRIYIQAREDDGTTDSTAIFVGTVSSGELVIDPDGASGPAPATRYSLSQAQARLTYTTTL